MLRFVECRHYAKEHRKLVQVGLTEAGVPVLKFVDGDYCLSSSGSRALAIAAGESMPAPQRQAAAGEDRQTPPVKEATKARPADGRFLAAGIDTF